VLTRRIIQPARAAEGRWLMVIDESEDLTHGVLTIQR
jgi:hypothetical protein